VNAAMQPERMPEFIGPYRVLGKLGEGGMGVVYEALHETIARRVAIKLLNRECAHNADVINRFFNEARATNLIDHPSVVQVSDLGQLGDGRAYIVMELLKGESLTRRRRRLGGRMSVTQAARLSWQIAEALAAAHRAGIVHRDLKPDNIMVVPDPVAQSGERAKILDFGIAKLAQGGPVKTTQSLIMGTPQYMSPEQCRGAAEVDDKTDVYSLGVMLYEMLGGQPPFVGQGSGDLLIMHVTQEAPPLKKIAPELPVSLTKFVHRLLAKDRRDRPDMATVARELALLGGSAGGSALDARSQSGSGFDCTTTVIVEPEPLSTRSEAASQAQAKRRVAPLAGRLVSTIAVAALLFWGVRAWKAPQHAAARQPALPLPSTPEIIKIPRTPDPLVHVPEPTHDLRPPLGKSSTAVEPSTQAPKSARKQRRDPRREGNFDEGSEVSARPERTIHNKSLELPPKRQASTAAPQPKDLYITD